LVKIKPTEKNLDVVAGVINDLARDEPWDRSFFEVHEASPERHESFPNKMVARMAVLADDGGEKLERITRCLIYLRPISAAIMEYACGKCQQVLVERMASDEPLAAETTLNLLRGMRKRFSPMGVKIHRPLLDAVTGRLSERCCAEALQVVTNADPDYVLANMEDDIASKLTVLAPIRAIRLAHLSTLHALVRCQNGEGDEAAQALEMLLSAEEVEPDVRRFRERRDRFQKAIVACGQQRDGRVKASAAHCLISQLYVNFAPMWNAVVELSKEAEDYLGWELMWGTLRRVIADASEDTVEEDTDHRRIKERIHKFGLKWIWQLDRTLSAKESQFLTDNFSAKVCADNFSLKRQTCLAVLAQFLEVFTARLPKVQKHREVVLAVAHQFLRKSDRTAQRAAAALLLKHVKGLGHRREELLELCDQVKWKARVRTLADDFREAAEASSKVRRILLDALSGMLHATAKDKASSQQTSRRVVLQSVELLGKAFLFDLVSGLVDELNASALDEAAIDSVWKPRVNYEMLIDLCVMAKPMMSPEHQSRMNRCFVILLRQMAARKGLFDKMRYKKTLVANVLRVCAEAKDMTSATLLDNGVVQHCLAPVFHAETMPGKACALMELFARREMFACLFADGERESLYELAIQHLDKGLEKTRQLNLDACCKIMSALIDCENVEQRWLKVAKQCWPQLQRSLRTWLSVKPFKVDGSAHRLRAMRLAVIKGWLNADQVKAAAKGLASCVAKLEAKFSEEWLLLTIEMIYRSKVSQDDKRSASITCFHRVTFPKSSTRASWL